MLRKNLIGLMAATLVGIGSSAVQAKELAFAGFVPAGMGARRQPHADRAEYLFLAGEWSHIRGHHCRLQKRSRRQA